MLEMNFSQMIATARLLLQETSGNTAYDTDFLKRMLNVGNSEFSTAYDFIWTEKDTTITAAYTTTSADAAVAASSLTLTSTSGFKPGQKIWIWSGGNYERHTVNTVTSATALTITGTLTNAHASGAFVARETMDLPGDFNRMFGVYDVTVASNLAEGERLRYWSPARFRHSHPRYASSGAPTGYFLYGVDLNKEPTTNDYTMSAGTTTTAQYNTLLGLTSDFYTGWTFVNVNRLLQSRVASYDVAQHILTLQYAIAGQTDNDHFYLVRRFNQMWFDTLMDSARSMNVWYYGHPAILVNDYDVPEAPGTCHMDIVRRGVAHVFAQDGQQSQADYYFQMSNAGLRRASILYAEKEGADNVGSIEVDDDDFGRSPGAQ